MSNVLIPKPKIINRNTNEKYATHGLLKVKVDHELRALFHSLIELTPNNGMELVEDEENINVFLNRTIDPMYILDVRSDGVKIEARDEQGSFYAFQTLIQLILTSKTMEKDLIEIDCVHIEDSPEYDWRGFMLDCGRHYFDKEFVKKMIDVMSFYKMNKFHWHLTEDQGWRVEIKKYPNLVSVGSKRFLRDDELSNEKFLKENEKRIFKDDDGKLHFGGYYSQSDIKEVVAYAADRFITVIPEIEMPGHCLAALASYPELSCTGGPFEVATEWGVYEDVFCAGKEATFEFLENVLDEVIDLFPSEFIHIGGDECPKERWKVCPKCQQRMKEEGLENEHELQSYFVQRISKYLEQKGKRMTGWDEILEGGIAKGATVQSWRGLDGAKQAIESGHDAILSPNDSCYLDAPVENTDLERVFKFDPGQIKDSKNAKVLGGEGPCWSEQMPIQERVEYMAFPRLMALSEVFWRERATTPNYLEFLRRTQIHRDVLSSRFNISVGPEAKPVAINAQYLPESDIFSVKLNTRGSLTLQDLDLYYTTDGSKPDSSSSKYKGDFDIPSEVTSLRSQAYFQNIAYGTESQITLTCNKATGRPVTLVNQPSHSYPGTGPNNLTNGVLGTTNFHDSAWQGWEKDDLIATVNLQHEIEISKIALNMLQAQNSWILFPEYVRFEVSQNGKDFEKVGQSEPSIPPERKGTFIEAISVNLPRPVRAAFIRVTAKNFGQLPPWHPHSGGDAWVFADQLIVDSPETSSSYCVVA